jgi:hypothetical protein
MAIKMGFVMRIHDVEQFMPSRTLTTRVKQVGEVVPQRDRFVVRHQAFLEVTTVRVEATPYVAGSPSGK